MNNYKKILLSLMIFCSSLLISNPILASTSEQSINADRLSGRTRYETAKAIAESYSDGVVQNIVLSTGNNFADALSASVLAHEKDAPILLVDTSINGSQQAFDYITQHLDIDGSIYIIGGTGVIGNEFETRLNDLGFKHVIRISGTDRYDTSYMVADALDNAAVSTVVISSGNQYSDALSISSFAANKGWPILLTPKDNLPQEMKNFLLVKKPSKVYITGGTGVISDNIKSEINAIVPQADVERLSGESRFDTNVIIAKRFKQNPSTVYLATAYGFADALAGSVLAAKNGDPIIFIDPSKPTLPKLAANYFGNLYISKLNPNLIAFGGNGVVTDEVMKSSCDLLSGAAKEDRIYSVDDIVVNLTQNKKYVFPSTVQAKLYNGDIIDVPVTWNSSKADTSKLGSTDYTGIISNYDKRVTCRLNVIYEIYNKMLKISNTIKIAHGAVCYYGPNGKTTPTSTENFYLAYSYDDDNFFIVLNDFTDDTYETLQKCLKLILPASADKVIDVIKNMINSSAGKRQITCEGKNVFFTAFPYHFTITIYN